MSTLIIRKDAAGLVTGRCDARCYNAKGSKCTCICSGINHGRGKNDAISETNFTSGMFHSSQPGFNFVFKHAQYQLFPGLKT